MFGSSPKEIAAMMVSLGDLMIADDFLKIDNYPFEPSVAFENQIIPATEVNDIDIKSFPPTIRCGHELIFLTAEKKDELSEFATRNGISIVQRSYIWEWILEPFLDTECTAEEEERILSMLLEHGVDNNEVKAIRALVEKQMMKYNFDTMLWEWVQLGASDVLKAMRVKYSPEEFRFFYQRVMNIALRTNVNS